MFNGQDIEEPLVISEQEFERELEQAVLNRMRKYLCDHLESERFFPYLQTKEYLDPETCEQIRSAGTTKSRTNKMLDILIRSGPNPLKVLIRAIEKTGPTQKFVTEKMKEEHARIRADPVNARRLEEIRSRIHFNPTAAYVPYVQPPPYSVLPTHLGGAIGLHLPSAFPTFPSSVHTPVTKSIKTPCPQTNGLTGEEANAGRLQNTGSYPATPSEAPDSIFVRDASHFRTSDFHTGLCTYGPKVAYPALLNDPSSEILNDQHIEEEKISLKHDTNLAEAIATNQEKELSKYDSSKTLSASPKQWVRTSRAPSEHDASETYARCSPINVLSTTANDIAQEANKALPMPDTKSPGATCMLREEDTSVQLKSPKCCHTGSIQHSCFTSSNFESCLPTKSPCEIIVQTDTSQPLTSSPPNQTQSPGPKSRSPMAQNLASRQFSTPLEPIPSIEVSSMENLESQSITIRRPPTEHEDVSLRVQSLPDDDNSSLEISTDSEASDN